MTKLPEDAFHPHLRARMQQRGISREEKVWVFPYNAEWEGRQYPEKEVTVYYRLQGAEVAVLTAKARYGVSFPRKRRE